MKTADKGLIKNILVSQKNEITEHFIYSKLSNMTKDEANKKVLSNISKDELIHYNTFKKYTNADVKKDYFKLWFYTIIAYVFGLTFSLKLMEKGESKAQKNYEKTIKSLAESKSIMGAEQKHESELINMINEQKLNYAGSIVLGLNDALVEITSTIAGITFTMQNSKLIATTGLIMGIAAALSMSASEYLSTKTSQETNVKEKSAKNPITALLYTGIAYIVAVVFIVLPYFIFSNVYIALITMLLTALTIIFLFTFYISVAKDVSFKQRFTEMAGVSMGVSAVTFLIGIVVRTVFGISI